MENRPTGQYVFGDTYIFDQDVRNIKLEVFDGTSEFKERFSYDVLTWKKTWFREPLLIEKKHYDLLSIRHPHANLLQHDQSTLIDEKTGHLAENHRMAWCLFCDCLGNITREQNGKEMLKKIALFKAHVP